MPKKQLGTSKNMVSLSRKRPPCLPIPRRLSGKTWNTPILKTDSRGWEYPWEDASLSWSIPIGEQKMTKKRFVSSPRAAQVRKSAKPTQNDRIDFSDLQESTDEELSRARRVGRPKTGNAKQLIAIRISPRLLAQLRRLAVKRDKPYQTLIHELLEKAARNSKVA